MNSSAISPILPLSTVKVVDAPILMSCPPKSATSRRKKLRDVADEAETNLHLKTEGEELDPITSAFEMAKPTDDTDQSSSTSASTVLTATATTSRWRSSGRVSWAARMVQFVRSIRRRLTKTKTAHSNRHAELGDDEFSDSPTPSRRFFGFGRKLTSGSPSCPSLVITIDESPPQIVVEETKEERPPSRWSLRVDESVTSTKHRKHSAGANDTHLLNKAKFNHFRKLTPDPSSTATPFPSTDDIATRLTEYVVNVKTSDRFGAGTDAKVFLQLFGDLGTTDVFSLHHSNNVNKFERNQLDRFVLRDVPPAGRLQSIKIWHDNSGVGAAWHLGYVEVSDTNLGLLFRFPCHAWLSETGDSQGVSRELRCFEVLEGPKKAIQTASGVAKQGRSDSLSALNVKTHSRSDSLPVTPVSMRKFSRTPPKHLRLPIPKLEFGREIPAESVFTPAPTRATPIIRLPLGDDDDNSESENHRFASPPYRHSNTVPVFSPDTLARAADRKMSLDGRLPIYGRGNINNKLNVRKRTVYGPISAPLSAKGVRINGSLQAVRTAARHASLSSMSSIDSVDAGLGKFAEPIATQ